MWLRDDPCLIIMKNLDGPLFDLHDDRCHGLHILCPPRTFLPLNETSTDICPPHPPKKKQCSAHANFINTGIKQKGLCTFFVPCILCSRKYLDNVLWSILDRNISLTFVATQFITIMQKITTTQDSTKEADVRTQNYIFLQ
jgi:hypothetical protein